MREIYLAGGCFWGLQKFMDQFDEIIETEVGYANGPEGAADSDGLGASVNPPTYEQVCRNSGHAETVRVTYDESAISLKEILDYYFMVIDPTSLNRQGMDIGVQYRTGIYYTDEADLDAINEVFQRVSDEIGKSLAVEVYPLLNFYSAEEYHQKYLEKNPHGYCHIPSRYFDMKHD